jgi:hypothetical protein
MTSKFFKTPEEEDADKKAKEKAERTAKIKSEMVKYMAFLGVYFINRPYELLLKEILLDYAHFRGEEGRVTDGAELTGFLYLLRCDSFWIKILFNHDTTETDVSVKIEVSNLDIVSERDRKQLASTLYRQIPVLRGVYYQVYFYRPARWGKSSSSPTPAESGYIWHDIAQDISR